MGNDHAFRGRVIVHFQSQVEKICTFIKENFEIDEANSLDAKSRLQVNEFGYRSVHYIVTPKKDSILGIKVDDKFKNLKAEIQVRTLAEHVWADISHDRIYKTDLNIPENGSVKLLVYRRCLKTLIRNLPGCRQK